MQRQLVESVWLSMCRLLGAEFERLSTACIVQREGGYVTFDGGRREWAEANTFVQRLVANAKKQINPARPGGQVLPEADPSDRFHRLWAELHARPWRMGSPEHEADWLAAFSRRVPCGTCQQHWVEILTATPPDFSSTDAYFAWTVAVHNAVNRRLGKPEIDVARARAIHAPRPTIPERPAVFPRALERRQERDSQRIEIAGTDQQARRPLGDALAHTSFGEKAKPLILRNNLCPGDILMLTAAVRDLHKAYPGRFITDVQTPHPALWENNPYATRLNGQGRVIDCHYPLIHHSNQRPYHFIHGFHQYLESVLNVRIPVTEFRGDIHLSAQERSWMNQVAEQFGHEGPFWLINAGGKTDYTAKWAPPGIYQDVVDHFRGRITFVQIGAKNDVHPVLRNVLNLVGKTDMRQMVRLMYHAQGVVCPVTFHMHLAAAVPTKNGTLRPCVVLAGGREPAHWEQYPGHQFLHTIGQLDCCANGGCWRSRCQVVGDGDAKDKPEGLCKYPVMAPGEIAINGRTLSEAAYPKCLTMIGAKGVIDAIERYLQA